MNPSLFAAVVVMTVCLTNTEVEREIKAIEQQISKAVLDRDTAFVEKVWHEDFVYTGVRGEFKSKSDLLRELKSGDLKFDEMRFEDIKVRSFQHTAIATGLAITKGRSNKGEITGEFRYTRVYVMVGGTWNLVAFHGIPVAKP